ncbi:reverse transcriptase-like protein [Bacillus sp. RG28]|uniref:Reverse transcriptase-like protein n=1 Tax=Gottfriedia endophytica TaxID=2820819 RepID=A0A940SI57_9BACI|nr:reverse transcriptase-like protein [Gottfriedia endophytica]MBP0724156.1 reverse transcriptase-like protein [Gottfriedia endophytica]
MIEVYIDGASKGNPGPSGAGVFIKGTSEPHFFSIPLPEMSNHEAEFNALIHALTLCIEKKYSIVSFRTDSKVVEETIEKKFTKNTVFKPLLDKALLLIDQFDLFFIKWIPSNLNKVADELARKAIK